MYGVLLKYTELIKAQHDFIEQYIDSPFDSKTNLKDDITVLYDGRGGKYIAIGHVEVKTENHGFFNEPICFLRYLGPPNFNFVPIFQVIDTLQLPYEQNELNLKWLIISHYR